MMRDTVIIVIVLLLLITIVSAFGGSVRHTPTMSAEGFYGMDPEEEEPNDDEKEPVDDEPPAEDAEQAATRAMAAAGLKVSPNAPPPPMDPVDPPSPTASKPGGGVEAFQSGGAYASW